MPINVVDLPAEPHCGGAQWFIEDLDELATLAALVLVGRAQHAASILEGSQLIDRPVPDTMRAGLQRDLFPPEGAPWHRDGLLFEIICWLVARQQAAPGEVISDPHTKATQQGADTVKVAFDLQARRLLRATIYEYKCTTKARRMFISEVLPAFRQYFEGARDPQLTQLTIALLERYGLTDAEQAQVYDTLVNDRPLSFRAALTVSPEAFPLRDCVRLFENYGDLPAPLEARLGDTFPVSDVRDWFARFAAAIWAKINV